jgi:glyoxylase-like metal-dependent hydrolase (beta-lactamase superfamily II)
MMAIVEKNGSIQIERLELGPYGANSYLLKCQKTAAAVVIDAPGETERILASLKGTRPQYILITHNHVDHIGGLRDLASALRVPVAAHPADALELPVPAEMQLKDGDLISVGALRLEVLHTPGHTPGSVCLSIDRFLIAGDTLFPGGPGHTRSPEDFRQILESITRKLLVLPDHTLVYPGHGEGTVLGKEKPAIQRFTARPQNPDLCGDVVWE